MEDDDDLEDLEDDDIPQSILEKYRSERMEEVKKLDKTRRYGSVLPIGRESYTREINEASEEDIDSDNPELKDKGTGVVCFLWKDGYVGIYGRFVLKFKYELILLSSLFFHRYVLRFPWEFAIHSTPTVSAHPSQIRQNKPTKQRP